MVEQYNEKAQKKIRIPAFNRWLFIQATDRQIRMVLDEITYVKDVWKDASGQWGAIPDSEFQAFLDRLEKRQKKAAKAPKSINMAEATELDYFDMTVNRFGLQVAIRQFGRDVRKEAEAIKRFGHEIAREVA